MVPFVSEIVATHSVACMLSEHCSHHSDILQLKTIKKTHICAYSVRELPFSHYTHIIIAIVIVIEVDITKYWITVFVLFKNVHYWGRDCFACSVFDMHKHYIIIMFSFCISHSKYQEVFSCYQCNFTLNCHFKRSK